MVEKRTRLKETREDVFEDMVSSDSGLEDPGLTFQEFERQSKEVEDEFLLDQEGAALFAIGEAEGGSRGQQRTVQTTTDDLYSARRFHDDRSQRAQARDEATTAQRVTGDFEVWSEKPGQTDFPGIDTTDDVGPIF